MRAAAGDLAGIAIVSAAPATGVSRCPACGASVASQVGGAAAAFDTTIDGRTFHQPAYNVRECRECGLYFKTVTLSSPELHDYYAALDGAVFDVEAGFPTDRALRQRLAALPPGARVLDFGCSTGRVLKDFTERLTCVGVEPNAAAAAMAQSRGISIIPDAALGDQPAFDAIVLADVFEHLTDPVTMLKRLVSRLAPNGVLAIVTGNADAIEDRSRLSEFWYFRLPGHVIMLGRRHIDWLAHTLGLHVDAVVECSHYDVGVGERLRQRAQAFAYACFQDAPDSLAARALRVVPRLRNAQNWSTAPALNFRADHVVAFLTRPAN